MYAEGNVSQYFQQVVIPAVEAHFPAVARQMSVLIEGSTGLGLHDEWSDLEATIYLDDPLWLEQGGQLQLLMMHGLPVFSQRSEPHCAFPGKPHSWTISGHPEINVHPISWLLDHHAKEFLDAGGEAPWEAVSIEALYALQHDLVLYDPSGALYRLRDATVESRYPPWLWKKRLVLKLHGLKGEPLDFEKAVARGDIPTASIVLGILLQGLLEIGFLCEQRYYPWRKHLSSAYRELPIAQQMLPDLLVLATGPDWTMRVRALQSLVDGYADAILERGILTSEMLEDLPAAMNGAAWSNPAWRAESCRLGEIALRAGYDVQDGWVWGLWRWA